MSENKIFLNISKDAEFFCDNFFFFEKNIFWKFSKCLQVI
jgi:hypothetical protein